MKTNILSFKKYEHGGERQAAVSILKKQKGAGGEEEGKKGCLAFFYPEVEKIDSGQGEACSIMLFSQRICAVDA